MKRYSWGIALCAVGVLLAQQPVMIRQGGNTAAVSAGGAVKVDGSAVTQPVSGTVAATQSGNWTARVVGNGGAVLDGVNTAATAPASGLLTLGIYNSTEPSPTTGQSVGIQLDAKGRTRGVIMDAAGNTRGANVNSSNQLSVSIDGSTATNISTNIAQMNGATVTMGNGVSGTGVQRVTIASDSTGTVAVTQSTSSSLKAQVDPLTSASWGIGATGSAPPANGSYQTGIGSGATGGLAIGTTVCDQWVDINTTSNAQLISGVSGRKVYFCSGNIQMNGGANTVAFVSGTGSTCGTGTTTIPGFQGSTTAANGYSFAANSGMTWAGANGAGFARTTNNADNVCILVGSATRVVGGLAYAIY